MAALPLLENNYALAQIIPEADSRLVSSKAEYAAAPAEADHAQLTR